MSPKPDLKSEVLRPSHDTSDDVPNDVYKLPHKIRLNEEDEIVISGISGRYPESDNIKEFWENLMFSKEMVSIDDSRWPIGE